jgi:hypothetical protein
VTRVPALGVGFFTAINDDDVGAALKPAIVYRILDDLLNLEPIDWEDRSVTRAYQKDAKYTPIPKDPRPAPEIDRIRGTYHAKGYDTINIQHINHAAKQGDLSSAAVDAVKQAMKPMYIASFPKVFVDVLAFSHFDGPIFNTTTLAINEGENGRVIANVEGPSSAVFVQGEGIGMFENFWGGANRKRAVEEDVEEQSEVWFSKT